MTYIEKQSDDDEQFISNVEIIIKKLILKGEPSSIYLIKIDNWFDKKWLKFSGKAFGAVGVFNEKLTVPPFVPNRVVYEKLFSFQEEDSDYKITSVKNAVHVFQESESNLNRKIKTLYPGSAFIWFSGATKKNRRGTIMSYFPFEKEYVSMHSELESPNWNVKNAHGLSKDILNSMLSNP